METNLSTTLAFPAFKRPFDPRDPYRFHPILNPPVPSRSSDLGLEKNISIEYGTTRNYQNYYLRVLDARLRSFRLIQDKTLAGIERHEAAIYFEVWCHRDVMEDARTKGASRKGKGRAFDIALDQRDGVDEGQPEAVTLPEFLKLLLLYGAPDFDIRMVAAGKRI